MFKYFEDFQYFLKYTILLVFLPSIFTGFYPGKITAMTTLCGWILFISYYNFKRKLFLNDFDGRNIIIHGITAEDVKNAPTMAEVWPKIKKLYQPGMLVAAHNARFDCRVMEKSLARYNIPAPHYFAIDTLATSKAFEPYLPNHKLDTVSEALNINLWHHHNALSDSEACAGILIEENKRVGDDPIKKMVKPI